VGRRRRWPAGGDSQRRHAHRSAASAHRGRSSPDAGMRGMPSQPAGSRDRPFSMADIGPDREMLPFDARLGRGCGSVLGDIRMSDDFGPQVMPSFTYTGTGITARGQGGPRGLSGLPVQQGAFDDSFLSSAPFLQRDSGRQDWGARLGRRSAQAHMHPHPFMTGIDFGGMHPHRSTAPAGPGSDGMAISTLMPHSGYMSQARSTPAQLPMYMSMMPRHGQQFDGAATTFPHDGAPGGRMPQRLETLPEDASMTAGLDALLHASALPSPFQSGRLATSRQRDFVYGEDTRQVGMRGRRLSGSSQRGSGALAGMAGSGALEYGPSSAMLSEFTGHQQQLPQRGHTMNMQAAGHMLAQQQQQDASGVPGMPNRMPAMHGRFQPRNDEWNSLGRGM